MRKPLKERATHNLERWLRVYRLPQTFPSLNEKPESIDQVFLRDEGREIKEILDAMQGSPRTMVVFPPGQGASTLLRCAVESARSSKLRLPHLFVVVEPSKLDRENLGESLMARIRDEVFDSLIFGFWEASFYAQRRQALFDILGVRDEFELDEFRLRIETLRAGDSRTAAQAINRLSEKYIDKEAALLSGLHAKLNLSTFLIFDFPHDLDDEITNEMVREIKWFFDENVSRKDFPPAAVAEAYFSTKMQSKIIANSWARDYRLIEIKPYSRMEVFMILQTRFVPRLAGREALLSVIFSEEFVANVWSDRKPLTVMMSEIRREMLSSLDVSDGDMPVKLQPKLLRSAEQAHDLNQ